MSVILLDPYIRTEGEVVCCPTHEDTRAQEDSGPAKALRLENGSAWAKAQIVMIQ